MSILNKILRLIGSVIPAAPPPPKPDYYSQQIECEFIETLDIYYSTGHGGQPSSNKKHQGLLSSYHVFNFVFNEVKYEFKEKLVWVWGQTQQYEVNGRYPAHINPQDLTTCWFADKELKVHEWLPHDEDD